MVAEQSAGVSGWGIAPDVPTAAGNDGKQASRSMDAVEGAVLQEPHRDGLRPA
jgi:hypothetical protein